MLRFASILLFVMIALATKGLDSSPTVAAAAASTGRAEQTVTIIVNQSRQRPRFESRRPRYSFQNTLRASGRKTPPPQFAYQ
jgi:hypothetical protein